MPVDWGEASIIFDEITKDLGNKNLADSNEAQTRFDIIDRLIREVLGWKYGQISVEEHVESGYIDYILRSADNAIVVEAKKVGASFPSPTKKTLLKLNGQVLGTGEIALAISQARTYAEEKDIQIVVVTNGLCWVFFALNEPREDAFANVLFPFSSVSHPEKLFNFLSASQVDKGSLNTITNKVPTIENRLIATLRNIDNRVDRNRIADFITPAIDLALSSEALLNDQETLINCFVETDNRTRFDSLLGMHLAESKPLTIQTAKRIKKDKSQSYLEDIVQNSIPSSAPTITLIIGPVGVGKSTYLTHFQLISGRSILDQKNAHWIYLDFEEMGREASPRAFIYSILRDYLDDAYLAHAKQPTDWKNVVEPAYDDEFKALARGPFALSYSNNRDEFNRKMQEIVETDYRNIEPYVDKVFRYITGKSLCIIVLDNVDLYEDEKLETMVFAEGLALSKRIKCNVIVSLRDTTFVKHQSNSTFNAYELRKLWLDPPPFKAVLSKRLSYSKRILEKRFGTLIVNNIQVRISDLSGFFDAVQRSVLEGAAGHFIESMADLDIRRGLTLITSFLTSGHIEAEKAIINYLKGDETYVFPFHEIFRGTMLGQWRHFQETRANCINVFDARLGTENLKLLRLMILRELGFRAQEQDNKQVPVSELIKIFSKCGASESHILTCLNSLTHNGLIKNITANELDLEATVAITRSGGYQVKFLANRFSYVEECMYDTAISDSDTWRRLEGLTSQIELLQDNRKNRLILRRERISIFLEYLLQIEAQMLLPLKTLSYLPALEYIKEDVLKEADSAVAASEKYDL